MIIIVSIEYDLVVEPEIVGDELVQGDESQDALAEAMSELLTCVVNLTAGTNELSLHYMLHLQNQMFQREMMMKMKTSLRTTMTRLLGQNQRIQRTSNFWPEFGGEEQTKF